MEDHDSGDQDMAQMMGFSSFGAQDRPQKKRRYNPAADAAVHGVDQQLAAAAAAAKSHGTGSNMTPLAASRPAREAPPVAATANSDEIDLGDEEDGDEDGGGGGATITQADTAGPTPSFSTGTLPHPGLPQRPAPVAESPSSHGGGGHRRHQLHAQTERSTGQPWWEGYYDTLSNRNPWERLEQSMGLQPRGAWISHGDEQTTTLTT